MRTVTRSKENLTALSTPIYSIDKEHYLTIRSQGDVKYCLPYLVKISLPNNVKNSLPYSVKKRLPYYVKKSLPNDVKICLTFATIIRYASAVLVNGIDFITDQTDLLERCLMIELKPISDKKRRTESSIEHDLNQIIPKLLGAYYDCIRRVLAMEDIKTSQLLRMADYEVLTTKAAVAMGFSAEEYQQALRDNYNNLLRAFSQGDVTMKGITEFMEKRDSYQGSMTDFATQCRECLNGKVFKQELNSFPGDSSAFSRRINGLKKQLALVGLTFKTKVTNKCTMIHIWHISDNHEEV